MKSRTNQAKVKQSSCVWFKKKCNYANPHALTHTLARPF